MKSPLNCRDTACLAPQPASPNLCDHASVPCAASAHVISTVFHPDDTTRQTPGLLPSKHSANPVTKLHGIQQVAYLVRQSLEVVLSAVVVDPWFYGFHYGACKAHNIHELDAFS